MRAQKYALDCDISYFSSKFSHFLLQMAQIQDIIINWYSKFERDLPWRRTKDAYFIWLSEVILQQTRVAQGLPYYQKFTQNYPTVKHLANASESEILNDWQGLGYYSRARNLHKTAQLVVELYQGDFPKTYHELIQLKGIGPYTAAAISSFSSNESKAVVDGNVYRVLSRIFDIETPIDSTLGKKEFAALAQSILPENKAGLFNQAIMEFGALQCVPANPDCANCPAHEKCLAFANKTVKERPVKEKKTKTRNRFFTYYIAPQNGTIILEKRLEKDIWQSLYQFPLLEFESETDQENALLKEKVIRISKTYKHVLSHQILFARFVVVEQLPVTNENQIEIVLSEFENYPVPRLIEKFWEENQKLLSKD